ncbi:hypothetical protein D3OALGA1CA_2723 [Olavius algarvensis associated proteobacterium Delta 3]|nr:hypothetical protein D3OALGB2SA_2683 [Olavius algarvensis associated proteobacterium Delta 3]CAB5123357.1 hypothetical protein D3OALGA1CA_2723 [Olavius algarvensis associated proteobacterium Delta 3]
MSSNFRLLIIDDDEETLFSLKSYFSKKSYDTVTAENGLEALKIIEKSDGQFDILITDIVMPTVTGVGVIKVLKKKYPKIPIIAMTGYGQHPEAMAAEAEADIILKKPIELPKLEESVISLLSQALKK